MPSYSYATLQDALNAVAARLYDSTFQQWTQSELTGYVKEALQTWNAMSGFWRSEMAFPLSQGQWWYDLRTQPGSIIPYTVSQYSLITQIENHLLEPPTPDTWTGSLQFSLSDILSALQRRTNEAIGTTACTVTKSLISAPVGGRVQMAGNVIDIKRVAWFPVSGFGFTNKILRQSDMWSTRAFTNAYTVSPQRPPSAWMQNTEPPITFDVNYAPPVPGQYEVLTVNAGPAWTQGVDPLLPFPSDWAWVAKWGALMDLLSRESNAKDALRADYCKRRYVEGLGLLQVMPTALALRLNNIPASLGSVRGGDDFNATWQSKPPAQPKVGYIASNQLAVAPAPSSGPWSATVSVCQNAPLPSSLGDFIQVGQDNFDTIIDLAHHLAMFKAGGEEFAATVTLYQNAQRKAALYNGKLKEMGFFSMDQQDLGNLEEARNPRYLLGTGPEAQ